MMVPKILTHAASVVLQNKMDKIACILGRKTGSKTKRHSLSASFLGSFTNVPATQLERPPRTALSNCAQGYVAHFRRNDHRLLLGNWNVLTITEKELE